ncbi:DUF1648 domain-containing protein [Chryseobacterium sp. Tr-659]|uniref:DUF1648 domain-containing protein n=1 Tax=Chryseobacterium sp. Tr-659 TaxID=2608340 RepID=UPI00141ED8C3|nr:DUF1648 domain-containing protein [Chryseobacterium sp. Tr-659]NIF03827.1 DUF1648 domain-containing protein [Chryseobacterium sp. Tr-659]
MENTLFIIFDVLNFGWVAFLWWFTLKNYNTLPEKIPVHFDLDGKPDRFGGKIYAYLMPVLAMLMFVLFVYITRHPEGANFPVEITEQNKGAQYLIMKVFLRVLFILIMVLFINNQDYMFRYSFDESAKPRIPMITIILSVIGFVPAMLLITHFFK